jgi:hypothetical protein
VPPSPPTCSPGPSDPLATQPDTHTQPLTRWLKTTCHDTTTNAKQCHPRHLGYKSRVQRPHTPSNNHHNGPMAPAGNATKRPHTAITLTAQDRPPQHYHQHRTTRPAPPHHATWWPNPCTMHPCPTHGTLHCPERLPGQPPQPTPQADPPKLTPTRHADSSLQTTPNPSCLTTTRQALHQQGPHLGASHVVPR